MTYPQMDPRRLDLTGTFGLRVAGRDAAEVRIGTAGRWEQRVNLATNPSFETTTGSYVTVRTNLATSPKSYTPATSGPHPGLGAGPYTGSADIDGVRQAVDPLALVGGTTYVRLLIESGTVPLGAYFDGDESPDPDLTPAWTGAVNASTSVLRGVGVAGVGGASGRTVASRRWAKAEASSLRIVADGATPYLYAMLFGSSVSAGNVNILQPGRTYRIRATAWLPEPQGGSLNPQGRARQLALLYNTIAGSSGAPVQVLTSVPNVAGEHLVAATVSVPATAVWAQLIAYQGATLGDIWWDALLIEDVTDLAAQWSALPDPKPTLAAWLGSDYFDGDTPNTPAALHHWTGTPHASTSVRTLAWQPGD